MNKKTKIGLSIFGLVFGISTLLSGCAPRITKTTSNALPPAERPVVAVSPSRTYAPQVTPNVSTYIERYPWLANYNIQSNSNNIHFAFNKSALTPLSKMLLKKDAIYLRHDPKSVIQIQGNCDRRGSEAYNLALGWRRANAAKSYLENLGINANRLQTISYGKEKPLCGVHTSACYAVNRRDHFSIISQ